MISRYLSISITYFSNIFDIFEVYQYVTNVESFKFYPYNKSHMKYFSFNQNKFIICTKHSDLNADILDKS